MITLKDIIHDKKFLQQLDECSKISKRIESGFLVYAPDSSFNSYVINRAVKGESDLIKMHLSEGGRWDGITFDHPGEGYCLPEKGHILLDIHFHPEWYGNVYPSKGDIQSTASHLKKNCLISLLDDFYKNKKVRVIQPISIIGCNKTKGQRFFIYQPLLEDCAKRFKSIEDDSFGSFIDNHYDMIRQKRSYKKIADYFNSNCFKAKIIHGKSGLKELKDFESLTSKRYSENQLNKIVGVKIPTEKELKTLEKLEKERKTDEYFENHEKELLDEMNIPTGSKSDAIDRIIDSENGQDEED